MKHLTNKQKTALTLHLISASDLKSWKKNQPKHTQSWIKTCGFTGQPGSWRLLPDAKGNLKGILVGAEESPTMWAIAHLPTLLPKGSYKLAGNLKKQEIEKLALGWLLGCYSFNRYKQKASVDAQLIVPAKINVAAIEKQAKAIHLGRDLINTPPNDMQPTQLAAAAKKLAKTYKAPCKTIVGENLLKQNYPAIHAVGRASDDAPRLVDFSWGNPKHPKVTLVGKGVCFDSGGLTLKSLAGMRLMKKDMGGAASVISLAQMVMDGKLKVRLRVLLPIVENAISDNAFRPSDVINTRKGLKVEIGNTDAEGRVILCDALAEGDKQSPDLMIDCATLTGAARVALGTDLPAFFTNDDSLAHEIYKHAKENEDPLWRLPLWQPYNEIIQSDIADIDSAPAHKYAGAITAALFLQSFIEKAKHWVHIDMMAYNLSSKPGRPVGGEIMGMRAIYALLKTRYGTT